MICYRWRVAIIGAAFLSSCSWITTFAVVNASRDPIEISYTIDLEASKDPWCPDGNVLEFPRVVPAKDVRALAGIRSDGPNAEVTCDEATHTVTLSLAPDHAASLFRIGGYTGPYADRDYLLAFSQLTIRGERGELQYAGRQLLRDFEKDSVGLWFLTYK